jgi:hypothetical protein
MHSRTTISTLAASLLLCALLPAPAAAKEPADVLGGRLVITGKKRLPMTWKNVGGFVGQVKRAENHVLWPDDKAAKEKVWSFEYIAFFQRPLQDREITIKIYQVDGGFLRLMPNGVFEQFLRERGARTFSSSVTLREADDFEVNKKYLVTIESKRARLASSSLILRGEGVKYSGKVDFSDADTKKKD